MVSGVSRLKTMGNERPDVRLRVCHRLPLDRCCPVSGNPQPGSEVRISYRAGATVLEVYALTAYLKGFVGGSPEGTRTLEGMIQQIAADAAEVLGVRVGVRADVLLQQGRVRLRARAG